MKASQLCAQLIPDPQVYGAPNIKWKPLPGIPGARAGYYKDMLSSVCIALRHPWLAIELQGLRPPQEQRPAWLDLTKLWYCWWTPKLPDNSPDLRCIADLRDNR
jgi:hypothetical protein